MRREKTEHIQKKKNGYRLRGSSILGRPGQRKWNPGIQHGWKASYTVEAAMILPIVVLVLCAMLILAFYIHDSGVFQGMACEAASAGSCLATEKERQEIAASVGKTDGSRFLGSRSLQRSVFSTEKRSGAQYSAVYPIPGMAARWFSGNELVIEKSWEMKMTDPAKAIWLIRGVKRIIDGGGQ